MSKGYYNNKILDIKKEVFIPELDMSTILKLQNNQINDTIRSFVKPSQISKLALDLNARVLMRKVLNF